MYLHSIEYVPCTINVCTLILEFYIAENICLLKKFSIILRIAIVSNENNEGYCVITFNTIFTSLHIKMIIYFVRCKIVIKIANVFYLTGIVLFCYKTHSTIFYT